MSANGTGTAVSSAKRYMGSDMAEVIKMREIEMSGKKIKLYTYSCKECGKLLERASKANNYDVYCLSCKQKKRSRDNKLNHQIYKSKLLKEGFDLGRKAVLDELLAFWNEYLNQTTEEMSALTICMMITQLKNMRKEVPNDSMQRNAET